MQMMLQASAAVEVVSINRVARNSNVHPVLSPSSAPLVDVGVINRRKDEHDLEESFLSYTLENTIDLSDCSETYYY